MWMNLDAYLKIELRDIEISVDAPPSYYREL